MPASRSFLQNHLLLPLALAATTGCATMGVEPPPLEEAWERVSLRTSPVRCDPGGCRTTVTAGDETIPVRSRGEVVGPVRGEPPPPITPTPPPAEGTGMGGWFGGRGSTRSRRVAVEQGWFQGTGSGGEAVHCQVFWVDVLEIESRLRGARVLARDRRTRAWDCQVRPGGEGAAPAWRFHSGRIPEPRELEELDLEELWTLARTHPVHLDRLGPGGRLEGRYPVRQDPPRMVVLAPDGRRRAVLYFGSPSTLDLAPDVPEEERQALLLIGAVLALSAVDRSSPYSETLPGGRCDRSVFCR